MLVVPILEKLYVAQINAYEVLDCFSNAVFD